MRNLVLAATVGAALTAASVSAQAMPLGPVGTPAQPEVTLVAGGCGAYFHRNPYGVCVRNGYYRPYRYYYGPGPYYRRPWARCGIHVGPIGIGGPC